MKNVTVSLDDATYRNARLRAAEMDRSLSAVVREFLQEFGTHANEFERLKQQEQRLRETVSTFSASDRLSRDELYDEVMRERGLQRD